MKSEILGAHSNPTYREYADDIHQSGQHLLNLINEILDLSDLLPEPMQKDARARLTRTGLQLKKKP